MTEPQLRSKADREAEAAKQAERLLEGLNPQQRAAVVHSGSPLLIVAGAGSGKTAVLTRRIAYLLATRAATPGQILAITFTNKAAAEMRERVIGLVGPRARAMWVSTFHSSCVRILRAQSALLPGLNSNFSIYDADDSRRLLTMIGRDFDLDAKKYSARVLATAISNLKNELVEPDAAAAKAEETGGEMPRLVADVYREYQRRLRAANAMDFDDLIGETVALLQRHPDVAEYYRRRFRHVLVDEYQDTNHAQYMLVRELVGTGAETDELPPSELCVVGDADQSIYAFRGATIRNIEEFERDYPDATTILLEQNYRSTQHILSAANAVISRNAGRRDKRLVDRSGRRGPDHRLRRRQRARRGGVRRPRDRPTRRRRRGQVRRCRRLLPHQQQLPCAGGDLHPARAAVPGGRRGAVLRTQGGPRRRRVPAGARQPRGHRQPAPHPQHPAPRHRRPGRGMRGRARRAEGHEFRGGAA